MHQLVLASALLALRIAPPTPETRYLQPQIAASGDLIAVTFGSANAVYFASSRDAGKTLSAPIKVADAPFIPVGRHRGPRIAITPKGIVITAITGTTRGKDGDVVAWRSTDQGVTWSKGVAVSDVRATAREGLHGMAAGADGTLFVTWLDLRSNATKLYGSVSTDGGATWSVNRLVYDSPDGHICECCHPSAAIGPRGELYAMWRNWLKGSRDIYLAVSHDKGNSFQTTKLGQGTWKLNACPMDGGGLAIDPRGNAYTVWRREGSIFAARPEQAESLLGKGKDPAIALGADGPYYAWTDGTAIKAVTPSRREPFVLAPNGAYPQLVSTGGKVFAAWEDEGAVQITPVN